MVLLVFAAGNRTLGLYNLAQCNAAQMSNGLPASYITPTVQGTPYYLCGNNWFSAAYGANGVY